MGEMMKQKSREVSGRERFKRKEEKSKRVVEKMEKGQEESGREGRQRDEER